MRARLGAWRARHRTALQALAFGLIVLASAGLYLTARSGHQAGTLALLGLVGLGMLLGLWAS